MAPDNQEPTPEEERERSLCFALGMCEGYEVAVDAMRVCFRDVRGGPTVADDRRLRLTEIKLALMTIEVNPTVGPVQHLIGEIETWLTELPQEDPENARLLAALQRYGSHPSYCPVYPHLSSAIVECKCGLAAILAGSETATTETSDG